MSGDHRRSLSPAHIWFARICATYIQTVICAVAAVRSWRQMLLIVEVYLPHLMRCWGGRVMVLPEKLIWKRCSHRQSGALRKKYP